MKVGIIPYKWGSKSAKALVEGSGFIFRVSRKRIPRTRYNFFVNWGCNYLPSYFKYLNVLNHPTYVRNATNKQTAFCLMKELGVPVPKFSLNKEDFDNRDHKVYCRTNVIGRGGQGIVIVEPDQDLINCPLYVSHFPSTHEYRIHCFSGIVISIQQKKRRKGSNADSSIRNYDNGWVFCRNDIDFPTEKVLTSSTLAVSSLGLDFGAVDILYNQHTDTCAVLEVNTAPGVEGTTVKDYVSAFEGYE